MSGTLDVADYAVLAVLLSVSTLIGVYYAWVSRRQANSSDFLIGGRTMTALPISLSLCASFMSSSTLLASPAEVYRYGAIHVLLCFAFLVAIVISSEFFLPVFYRLSLTSTNEYLELRFNRATRLLGTVLFMVQIILYSGIIIYGPALAISQVTDVNLWGGILLTGSVCILYSTLGGLKAVVWTDVFQIGIMIAGYMSVAIMCSNLQGGLATIISDAQQGGRINVWDFDLNPLRRYTFWTLSVGGTFVWTAVYGVSQGQVQRYVSCKSLTHARVALYINLLGLFAFQICSLFIGMSLYSVYKDCDPWTAGFISTTDQLMPYLVVNTFTSNPGLPGLFIAAVYSGSLSTVSSSINALAAVTVVDLIKPYTNLSEKQLTWVSRGMSRCLVVVITFLFGGVCIAVAGLASIAGGLLQTAVTIAGVGGGPLLGLFTMGFLCPFANSKGVWSGVVSGLVVGVGVTLVSLIYPPTPDLSRPLPLTTAGCNFTTNVTSTALPTQTSTMTITTGAGQMTDDLHLFTPSYLYFSVITIVTTIIVGLITSALTGDREQNVDPRLMIKKEDTTLYHAFVFFRNRVMRRTGKVDLPMDENDTSGKINPSFCDMEMD